MPFPSDTLYPSETSPIVVPPTPGVFQPPTPTFEAKWTMIHLDHAGNSIGEIIPANLEWSKRLNSIGTVVYDIPFSSRLATRSKTRPYATDFALYLEGDPFIAGLHSGIQKNLDSQTLQVSGRDWGHYFEQRIYPFDPSDPALYFYAKVQVDMLDIIRDILFTVMGQDGSLQIVVDEVTQSGLPTNYRIEAGDSESVFEKLAHFSEQDPSFDFEFTPERELIFYAPKKGALIGYTLEKGRNLEDVSYLEEDAPANWILGLGAGTGTPVAAVKQNTTAFGFFRRLDKAKSFGDDFIDKGMVRRLTQGELEDMQSISRVNGATIASDSVLEVLQTVGLGDTIRVIANDEYDEVDEELRVIGMSGTTDTLELEFEHGET